MSLTLALLAVAIPSSPDLGKADAQCRPRETGPAILVSVVGLKDRTGRLKLEVYPSNNQDFLADDNVLIMQNKTFRRVEVAVPPGRAPLLCVRVPASGAYSISVLHDRDTNRKFGLSTDGIGFSRNPVLGMSKPKSAATRIIAGSGLTPATVVMNYRRGLFRFRPLKETAP